MTLHEWSQLTSILPTHPTTECSAVSVIVDHLNEHRSKLWRLTDYAVSSVCGIVIWLVPRKRDTKS